MSRLDSLRSRVAGALGAMAMRAAPRPMASSLAPTPPGSRWVNFNGLEHLDSNIGLWNTAGQVSSDEQYLRHRFRTWQGWYQWADGWSPKRAREAVTMHIKGWPYMSAAIARDMVKYPPVFGALKKRCAPSLRTTWRIEGPDRAQGRYAVEDLRVAWRDFREHYADTLRTMALMGGQWAQVWWELDPKRGVEIPRIERWPWEACMWRAESPAFPGGWYAMSVDSGFVRMTPGDGHWLYFSQGFRSHEMGAVIALATTFVAGELGRRDEAGLSEAAGRVGPLAILPDGVKITDPIGEAVQLFVENFGLARVGGVLPHGTELKPFEVVSDTDFFKNLTQEQLLYVGLVVLGQAGALLPGTQGVYRPLESFSVDEALVDEDLEATCRGMGQLCRAYCEINGQDSEDSAGEPLIQLVGERFADRSMKAKSEAEKGTLLADWAIAATQAFDVQQGDVDVMAGKLSTPTMKIKPAPKTPPALPGGAPGGAPALPPPPNLAEKDVALEERADERAPA
jgi:hypothetical protein